MVFSSPEIGGVLDYRVSLGKNLEFLFVPFVYFGFLYMIWRLGRTTNVVLASVLVATLWMISLLAPSSIGWYVWSLPLVICLIPTRRMNLLVAICVLQLSAIATELLSGSSNEIFLRSGSVISWAQLDPALINALRTLTVVCGLVVVVSITRYWLKTGDQFSISRFPLSVGIAGDSGVGKDTLAKSLLELVPLDSGQMICGDDYHRFDRKSTEWLSRTHLDPIMNNLGRFATDIRLARKRVGFSGFSYDHSLGRFSVLREVKPPDLMVVNGLHSFYVGNSEDLYDLKVFISMDESLRQKLKIERDVLLRGRSASYVMESIRTRSPDSKSFIQPQCELADIHVHYSSPIEDTKSALGFRSTITLRNFVFIESLSQCFNSVIVIPHRLRQLEKVGEVELVLEPCEVASHQILSILNIMEPSYAQVFPTKTLFPPGTLGLVTLTVLIGLLERRSVGKH
jgi:uridine kinase